MLTKNQGKEKKKYNYKIPNPYPAQLTIYLKFVGIIMIL